MKTNQIMTRRMGDFNVYQRTKDAYFNATELIKQWNTANFADKDISEYLRNNSTKEFIQALEKEPEFLNTDNSPYLAARGKNGGTWMHPLLFIDFAMWLNPAFKVKVIKFVSDEMIKFRNLAGDAYPSMCKAIASFTSKDKFGFVISKVAKALNIIVYGIHEHDQRNKIGDESKIRELYELERQVALWVNLGFVTDYESLTKALRKLYIQKHPNIIPM